MSKELENENLENEFDGWEEFFEDLADDPLDEENFIKSFDRKMKKTLVETAAEIDIEKAKEQQRLNSLSPEEFWREMCSEKISELKQKDIEIVELEEEIKNNKEIIKDIYTSRAVSHVLAVMFSLSILPAAMYYLDAFENIGINGFLILIIVSIIAAAFFHFFTSALAALLVHWFKMETYIKEDKRLKPTIITIIAWIIFVSIIMFFPI